MFSLRIVTTDHYQTTPIPGLDVQYSDLRGSNVWKVPVVRIYGTTPGGQKACMHVHGVFPYLYVPYDGTQPWDRYLRLFANSLDKALNVSLNNANAKTQHVYKINLVAGIPMYGYHDKEEQFLKIFLYNPGFIKKAADLLLGGAVMNKAFQPHEAHIPYVLQMFIDYNLYGMNMINVAAVKFRKEKKDEESPDPHQKKEKQSSQGSDTSCPRTPTSLLDKSQPLTPARKTWDVNNIPEDMYLDDSVTRQSTCELECDIVAPDILNRLEVDANIGTNPGLAALWEDEKQRKRNMGESSQIEPPASQERTDVEISESDEMFRLKFEQIVHSHQPYMDSQQEDDDFSQETIPDVTPASALESQLSQDDTCISNASQDTVIVEGDEEEEGMKPIISVDSIKRVVSMSQSFTGSQPLADSQDKSLAEILASLADDSSPASSQEVSEQITALEERDSILLDKAQPVDEEVAQLQEEETLEMSQVVWDSGQQDEEKPGPSSAEYDVAGLDDSWNVSQFLRGDDKDDDDDDDDVIPQFDGAGDDSGDDKKTTKRLDIRGPVVTKSSHSFHGYNQTIQVSTNQNHQQVGQQNYHSNPMSHDSRRTADQRINTEKGHQFHINSLPPNFQTQDGNQQGYNNLQSSTCNHQYQIPPNMTSMPSHNGNLSSSPASSRSNIRSPSHDSSQGSLHSPAQSSHTSIQSPTGSVPMNEDSQDSIVKPTIMQRNSSLQSPYRMTPSPENDDFTVHHFSQDNSNTPQSERWHQNQQQKSPHHPSSNMHLPSQQDRQRQWNAQFHQTQYGKYGSYQNQQPYQNVQPMHQGGHQRMQVNFKGSSTSPNFQQSQKVWQRPLTLGQQVSPGLQRPKGQMVSPSQQNIPGSAGPVVTSGQQISPGQYRPQSQMISSQQNTTGSAGPIVTSGQQTSPGQYRPQSQMISSQHNTLGSSSQIDTPGQQVSPGQQIPRSLQNQQNIPGPSGPVVSPGQQISPGQHRPQGPRIPFNQQNVSGPPGHMVTSGHQQFHGPITSDGHMVRPGLQTPQGLTISQGLQLNPGQFRPQGPLNQQISPGQQPRMPIPERKPRGRPRMPRTGTRQPRPRLQKPGPQPVTKQISPSQNNMQNFLGIELSPRLPAPGQQGNTNIPSHGQMRQMRPSMQGLEHQPMGHFHSPTSQISPNMPNKHQHSMRNFTNPDSLMRPELHSPSNPSTTSMNSPDVQMKPNLPVSGQGMPQTDRRLPISESNIEILSSYPSPTEPSTINNPGQQTHSLQLSTMQHQQVPLDRPGEESLRLQAITSSQEMVQVSSQQSPLSSPSYTKPSSYPQPSQGGQLQSPNNLQVLNQGQQMVNKTLSDGAITEANILHSSNTIVSSQVPSSNVPYKQADGSHQNKEPAQNYQVPNYSQGQQLGHHSNPPISNSQGGQHSGQPQYPLIPSSETYQGQQLQSMSSIPYSQPESFGRQSSMPPYDGSQNGQVSIMDNQPFSQKSFHQLLMEDDIMPASQGNSQNMNFQDPQHNYRFTNPQGNMDNYAMQYSMPNNPGQDIRKQIKGKVSRRGRPPKYLSQNPLVNSQLAVQRHLQKKRKSKKDSLEKQEISSQERRDFGTSEQDFRNQLQGYNSGQGQDFPGTSNFCGPSHSMEISSQHHPKFSAASSSLTEANNLPLRIPSASMVMGEKGSSVEVKSNSAYQVKDNDDNSNKTHSTLEKLLLYGDENYDESRATDVKNSPEKLSTSGGIDRQSSHTSSMNESADLFSDISQTSTSSKQSVFTPGKSEIQNPLITGMPTKSSLLSLESLVGNVQEGANYGYHFKSPIKGTELNLFRPPSVDNVSISSQGSSDRKSPGFHGVTKSPSHSSSKSPSHQGMRASGQSFHRSFSYDGSQNIGKDSMTFNNCTNSKETYCENDNNIIRQNLNRSWSTVESTGTVEQKQKPFHRSQSFTLEQQVNERRNANAESHAANKRPMLPPNPAYSFTFHVPTPVYKRLKFKQTKQTDNVKVVRMHPMDARRYSLLKIGRETVKIKKLTQKDIDKTGLSLCGTLDELLSDEKDLAIQKQNLSRSHGYSSGMKSPYEVKTSDIRLNSEFGGLNEKKKRIRKKSEKESQLPKEYPIKMIVPPAQTLDELSGDCHAIKKVTLTSIIENVLMSSINNENSVEKVDNPQGERFDVEMQMDQSSVMGENGKEYTCLGRDIFQTPQHVQNQVSTFNHQNIPQRNSYDEEQVRNYQRMLIHQQYQHLQNNNGGFNHQGNMDAINRGQVHPKMVNNYFPNNHLENSEQKAMSSAVRNRSYSVGDITEPKRMEDEKSYTVLESKPSTITNKPMNNPSDMSSSSYSGSFSANIMFPPRTEMPTPSIKISSPVTNEAPSSGGQVCRKVEKQPRRKNLMLCRKRSMNKMLTTSPFVIDPDLEDRSVILKDVSLTEASEGTLTPIKSRTPVAGRSPICAHVGENYKLFDGDLQDDIESKLKELGQDVETGNKIFGNIMSEKESGSTTETADSPESSSRTSSRKNSSESMVSEQNNDHKESEPIKENNPSISPNISDKVRELSQTTEEEEHVTKALSVPGIIVTSQDGKNESQGHKEMYQKALNASSSLEDNQKASVIGRKRKTISESSNEEELMATKASKLEGNGSEFKNPGIKLNGLKSDEQLYVNGESGNESTISNSSRSSQNSLTFKYGKNSWTKVKSQGSSDLSSESSQDSSFFKFQSDLIDSLSEKETKGDKSGGYFRGFRISMLDKLPPVKLKKKLSLNNKLQVAFLTKSRKRKKPVKKLDQYKKKSNLISGLSLLHEATLANLSDIKSSSQDCTDHDSSYEDVMYKLALYSSPETDSLDGSLPLPLSPEELAGDKLGISRSTSDSHSPALGSDSSVSPVYSSSSSITKKSPVYPNTFRINSESCNRHQQKFELESSENEETLNISEASQYLKEKLAKKVVVKLKRLSTDEINKLRRKKFRDDSISSSPPDLGPPNILKYQNSLASGDESASPPRLSDQELISLSSGPENSPVYPMLDNETDSALHPRPQNRLKSSPRSFGDSSSEEMPLITGEEFDNCQNMIPSDVNEKEVEQFENCQNSEDTSQNQNENLSNESQSSQNSDESKDSNQQCPSDNENDIMRAGHSCSVHVIKPKIAPPSRKHVTKTALSHGLNLANNQAAFCGNPDDLPEKPRELGGRVIKIESFRMSDLVEFESDIRCDKLDTWRQLLLAGDQIVENCDISDKLNKEPQLLHALIGDKSVIITPCNPAPNYKLVTDWMIGRQKYKKLQLEKVKNNEKNVSDKSENANKSVENKCNVENVECMNDKNIQVVKMNVNVKSVSFTEPCDKKLTFSICDKENTVNQNPPKISEAVLNNNNVDMVDKSVKDANQSDIDIEDDVIGPSPPDSSSQCSQVPIHKPLKKVRLFSSQFSSQLVSSQFSSQQISPLISARIKSDISSQFSSQQIHVSPLISSRINSSPNLSRSLCNSQEQLQSTPLRKSSRWDFIMPACTPINHLKREAPRRVPLSKRLSLGGRRLSGDSMSSSQLQQFATPDQRGHISQIDGPTPKNSFGFQVSQQNFNDAKALHENQNITILSMELLAASRGDHLPDPEVDAIEVVFYSILNDVPPERGTREITGVILIDPVSARAQKEQEKVKEVKSDADTTPQSTPGSPQPSTSQAGTGSQKSPSSTPGSQKPSTSKDTRYSSNAAPSTPDTQNASSSKGRSKNQTDKKAQPSPCQFKPDAKIDQTILQKSGVDGKLEITYVETEKDLFQTFIDLVRRWDPEILVGYEIQKVSWGFLLQRAAQVGINLCSQISRIPEDKRASHFSAQKDEYGADHMSEIHVVGRIVINLWRIIRHEVTLNIYTFENVMYHVLHQRTPCYSFKTLNSWFRNRAHLYRWRVIDYFTLRVKANLDIMNQVDLIGRTSEFARVFGIEFYHVLSRGSQYRVESMMLRLAKPMNFIPASPSVHQRARMRAPECIALTLEPESRFYHDPVVVVDFQSLYPSIMIAYNYCFSTCVGRINLLEKAHEGAIEFGCTNLKIPPSVLKKIKDDITVSPNGVVFVKQHVRKGVISAMVEDILNTRIMVKKAMKDYKKDKTLHRMLDARQLGLKLIANVTYGYTGANFSGRMPCIEVGDSIVRKARETLERSIKLVEDTPRWGAKVVYGDTDSMFILLKGRSKDDAFKIGYEICDAVTAMHPSPIKLKFEKVYLPCVLQTKKRYVGFSYETPDQKEPVFDAKGIETVRRDACPAVAKILERSIKVLFTTKDVSQVKQYVQNQCRKLMEGKVSMQDLTFAKEYRGMPGYKPGACVPALEIAKKCLRQDRRSEPCVGARVPYVIVYGSPGLPLIQLVRQPWELLADPSLRINATYYITKQILPPLERMLSLLGVDVLGWYNDMPKVVRVVPHSLMSNENKKGTISQYFSTSNCPVCDKATNQNICNNCLKDPQMVAIVLNGRIKKWETVYHRLIEICNSCMGALDEQQPCTSLDCPILYRRSLAHQDNVKSEQIRDVIQKCLDF